MLQEKRKDLNQNLQIPKTENQKKKDKKNPQPSERKALVQKDFLIVLRSDLHVLRYSPFHSGLISPFSVDVFTKTSIFLLFSTPRPLWCLRILQLIPPAGNLPPSVVTASRPSDGFCFYPGLTEIITAPDQAFTTIKHTSKFQTAPSKINQNVRLMKNGHFVK